MILSKLTTKVKSRQNTGDGKVKSGLKRDERFMHFNTIS